MINLLNDLLNWTGSNNTSGNQYGFWSGFGSDIAEFAIFGSLIGIYRNKKCVNCWRIAHHSVQGTPYKTCHRHLTIANHDKLHAQHKYKFPLQHKFLNNKEK